MGIFAISIKEVNTTISISIWGKTYRLMIIDLRRLNELFAGRMDLELNSAWTMPTGNYRINNGQWKSFVCYYYIYWWWDISDCNIIRKCLEAIEQKINMSLVWHDRNEFI